MFESCVGRVDAVHVGLQRDRDPVRVVPELLGEDLARRLDADDPEPLAFDRDVAADRVRAAEELGSERGADDGDGRAPALVVLGQAAAHRDRPVHPAPVVGPHAVDPHPLRAAGDLDGRLLGRAGQVGEDLRIRRREARQIFGAQSRAHREPLLFLRRLGRLRVEHDRAVPAHSGKSRPDLVHDAVHDGAHDDEREDAEHQQGQRQRRAQLVRPELDEAALDDLPGERELRAHRELAALRLGRTTRDARGEDGFTHSAAPPWARGARPSTPGRARRRSRTRRPGSTPTRSSSGRCAAARRCTP